MFLLTLLIFFLIPPCIWSVPRKRAYNCCSMTAELFQVPRTSFITGQKSFQFKGKDYENMVKNIPLYDAKIRDMKLALHGTVPSDFEEATTQFLEFRKELFARDELETYVVNKDQEFKEKMKLLEFAGVIGCRVQNSFNFLVADSPYDWLDKMYSIYQKILVFGLNENYIRANRVRMAKDTAITDFCKNLAVSLKEDTGWTKGMAKNALTLVFKCYDLFPFSYETSDQIFNIAILMIKFYVFNNFTSDGLGSDTIFQTSKEQRFPFDSHFRFFQYMTSTLNNINDAHISSKLDCYDQFTFLQPLNFQNAYEFSKWDMKITKVNTPELQEWVDSEVVGIDGDKHVKTVSKLANFLGKSHTFFTRYQLGISRLYFDSALGDFRLDRGLFLKRSIIPNRDYVIYSLKKPNSDYVYQVKVNWLVFTNPGLVDFKDQHEYWRRNCEANPFTKVVKKASIVRRDKQVQPILLKKRKEFNRRNQDNYVVNSDGTLPISIGPGFAFFIMNNADQGNYGVLIIQTFDVDDMDGWFNNMRKGFLKLIEKGIKTLVLDLTGNSGGILCLAYSLLGVLSPSETFPFPATKNIYGTRTAPTDALVKISNCVAEAGIKGSPFKIQSFTNLTSRTEFSADASWESESEVKPKIVNGFQSGFSRFSPFLMDKCVLKQTPLLSNVKPEFDTIILVTDGLCGSSCAVVATYIQQSGSPTIIFSIGDPGDEIPNAFSFAGGQVVNLNNIKDIAKRTSCFNMIPEVLERMQMTITYRAIFNLEDKKIPLEYYILPAHYRFSYDEATMKSFAERWKLAFVKGLEIKENIDEYTYDPTEKGTVVGSSQ